MHFAARTCACSLLSREKQRDGSKTKTRVRQKNRKRRARRRIEWRDIRLAESDSVTSDTVIIGIAMPTTRFVDSPKRRDVKRSNVLVDAIPVPLVSRLPTVPGVRVRGPGRRARGGLEACGWRVLLVLDSDSPPLSCFRSLP